MKDWKELAVRIKKGKTTDNLEMALLEDERMRWQAVLMRLTAIVWSLAVRNLALRRNTEMLYTPSNGSFLKEIELLAQFDPIMKEHLVFKIVHLFKPATSVTPSRMSWLNC